MLEQQYPKNIFRPGSEVIKLVSCSTQLSMKFLMLGSDKPRMHFSRSYMLKERSYISYKLSF